MMKQTVVVIVLFSLLALVGCSSAPAPSPAAPQPQFKPAANLKDVMAFVVDYNAKQIWNVAPPKDDEEWHILEHEAVTLGEMGNVIMMPHLAKDNEDWTRYSQAMIDAALEVRKPIQGKNLDGLVTAGSTLVTACEQCHMKYYKEGVPIDKALPATH
jgi:hypothetical protein